MMAISYVTQPATSIFSDKKPNYLGLLLAGILMGLWPAWPLAWFALVPLWWIVHRQAGVRQSALCALVWGVGYHGTVLEWIWHLHPMTWLGIPWIGSLAIALFAYGFVTLWGAGIAITWAVGMAALQQLTPLNNIGRVLVGTALWCGVEALWSISPLYWTSLAITQSPSNLMVVHLARISGHLTITAVIVAVNGLLALATHADARRWVAAAIGILAIAHLAGWGLFQQSLQNEPAAALNIGIIQGNIPSREKLTPQGIRRAEDLYRTRYQTLAEQGADAVLTPEGAMPTLWKPDTSIFSQLVRDTKVPLWLGTFTVAPRDNQHIHQSLVEITPDSTTQYNKIKLVPLGEYIPLQSVFGDVIARLSPISTEMLPGHPAQQFETALGAAAVGICYDSAYGWIFRDQIAQGGEFILTASNNDPYPKRMMAQHHGQDVIQAISTDRWAVRGTNTGLSAVVTPHGQTTWMSEPLTLDSHIETIYRRDTQTPYVQWGDWLTPLLLLLSGVWVVRSHIT